MGVTEVQNIARVREGLWLIVYTHECDCGCTKTRHSFTVNSKLKPTANKAKQLADADFSKQ